MKVILLYLLFLANTFAGSGNETAKKSLGTVLSRLPRSTNYGILVYNPQTGDTVYSVNKNELFIPASNEKLYTAAAALKLLGPDYKLETKIYSDDNEITDGIIDGNLYLKGFGNSLLCEADIDTLAMQLDALGIKKITGKILGDDSYFDNNYDRKKWIEGEKPSIRVAPISALNVDRSNVVITMNPNAKPGSKLRYSVKPDLRSIEVVSYATAARGRTTLRFSAKMIKNKLVITVNGRMKTGKYPKSYAVNFPDPPLYAAFMLNEKLKDRGISNSGGIDTGITPDNANQVASVSLPLTEIVSHMNKRSDNYIAETLFKTLGAYASNEQGTVENAAAAVNSFVANDLHEQENVSIFDGSGISRFNKTSVASLSYLLDYLYHSSSEYEIFRNSLSVAGIDGTLRRRFRNSNVKENFFAKTGSLRGISSLSGFLKTSGDQDLIVSIIMEYDEVGARFHKDIQDEIIELLWREN